MYKYERPSLGVAVLLLSNLALGALYSDPAHLPADKTYDYVVVGAGAGGAVVATRLAEMRGVNVLLVEAGGDNVGDLNLQVPFFAFKTHGSIYDWNFTTVEQPGFGNRSIPYTRGKVLGGSTSINGMIYNRASRDDWDRFAAVTGDNGWSWNNMEPYMKKAEKLVTPADGRNVTGEIDPSIYGHKGPLNVSLTGFTTPSLDSRVVDVAVQSTEFPLTLEDDGGDFIGTTWAKVLVADGERVSSAKSYIQPGLQQYQNLDVVLHSQVTKIVQTGVAAHNTPIFRGVQISMSAAGPHYHVNATTEIILSAGTIGSPHILLLSGIGERDQLDAHGIKTILELPDVGKNAQDQPFLFGSYSLNASVTDTLDPLTQNQTFSAEALQQWEATRTGPMASVGLNQIGWYRLPGNASIFNTIADPSSGPTTPHFEVMFRAGAFGTPPAPGNYLSFGIVVLTPTTRGSLRLNSSDPFVQPLIDPGLLNSEFDIFTMREGMKAAQSFLSAQVFNDYIIEPVGAFANAITDAELDTYAQLFSNSIWHFTSTNQATRVGSAGGVVNPDLTVKGTKGLRIVDASVFPFIPAAHPQGCVYFLAERAADLIKAAYSS
ncbi:alcohol oxidase [Mycena polygramma]|nr:alcohol oxidase [Mycena polygramma]